MAMLIRPFELADQPEVIALWAQCGLTQPQNDPARDIARKLTVQPELFLVGILGSAVVATAMVGFDGHRGWVYYLAVAPLFQRLDYGRRMMAEAERLLIAYGCPKLNLQVRSTNTDVIAFYEKLGYVLEDRASMGKRLIPD